MRTTEAVYGALPVDLGLVNLSPSEMMLWQYCPIKTPDCELLWLPDNLLQFRNVISAVRADCEAWRDRYVYLTAKTLWATPSSFNRPGWHSDGFLTDDLNYIWYDGVPTVFFSDGLKHAFAADHNESLVEMQRLCESKPDCWSVYPEKHLLRLDERVLHKADDQFKPRFRSFLKISVSRHRYALLGNSINHQFPERFSYSTRVPERNCPTGALQ